MQSNDQDVLTLSPGEKAKYSTRIKGDKVTGRRGMAKAKTMSKRTLVINPVTRVEGHGRVTLQLDEQGKVADARFHVTQPRGFEKLCEGRPFYEMPSLMARICGICPVSHLIASAKACDQLLAGRVPPTAD